MNSLPRIRLIFVRINQSQLGTSQLFSKRNEIDYLFMMERFVLNVDVQFENNLSISQKKTDQMTHLAHSVRIFSFSLSFLQKFIKNSSNQGVD